MYYFPTYTQKCSFGEEINIREVMDRRGMRKIPGGTIIELNNEIYEFVAGDKSHDQYKDIYENLDEMGRQMKATGCVLSTLAVLLHINEEDKEDAS